MKTLRSALVDFSVSVGLFLGTLTCLLKTTGDLGYARDEGFYFHAASSYRSWFELFFRDRAAALAPRVVDAHWTLNHEHPGLIKSLFALSNLFLQKKHHLFAMEGDSYRFPAMVLSALTVALVYLWGKEARGRVAGLGGALLFAAMPRFFYHAHLACFDAPIVAIWTLTAYAYWKSLRSPSLAWPVLTGIFFGLALDTKHNSWFLPFFVVGHFATRELLVALEKKLFGPPKEILAIKASRRGGLLAMASMAALGPPLFYALWPWIWHDTVARLQAYARFHLGHEYYNMELLGQNYWQPPMPRSYAWVMTAATVPTITLLCFGVGVCVLVGGRLRAPLLALVTRTERTRARGKVDPTETALLWLFGVVINYAAWLSPTTPIFGGTKHWMTAYPFLALFAGAGVERVVRVIRAEILRRRRVPVLRFLASQRALPAGATLACVVLAPLAETAHSHPWGLSSYTPLVGGAAGGATLGLNRTFWGYATGAIAEDLNREVERGGKVYIHDTAGPSWDMLQQDGRLRRDIHGVWSVAGADYALYHHEKHMRGQEFQAWVAFGTASPVILGGIDGVPVIHVYKKKKEAGQGR